MQTANSYLDSTLKPEHIKQDATNDILELHLRVKNTRQIYGGKGRGRKGHKTNSKGLF